MNLKGLRIRTKLLAAFSTIVFLSVVNLFIGQHFNAAIIRHADHRESAIMLQRQIEAYLHWLHDLSSGLFMVAAGEEDFGRSVILESRLAMAELKREFERTEWAHHAISLDDMQPTLAIADELAAEAERTLRAITSFEDAHATDGDHDHSHAELHLSLARARNLTEQAGLYGAQLAATLQADTRAKQAQVRAVARLAGMLTLSLEIGIGALALLFSVMVSRSLSRRLADLERAAQTIGSGDFSHRAEVRSRDELGALAQAFNRMAADVQAKSALLLSKEYVEKILDTMTNCLFVLEPGGRIERVNRATCQLLGRDQQELLGTELGDLLDTGDAAAQMAEIMSGTEQSLELGVRTRDGKSIPVALASAVMDHDVASQQRVVCVADDITERKELFDRLVEAKKAAEQADQAKSAFLANMSHELRTPLNGIMGYAQILLMDKSLDDSQRVAADIMYRSGDHLLTLLNDILDLSKIEAGRMELHQSEFHLPGFVQEIVDIFRVRAQQKNIHFLCEKVSELPVAVRGDQKRLRQILLNLLGNAIKFTEHGGVVLKVGVHYGKIRFQVEDTGVGIPAEHLAAIFKPFKQVGEGAHAHTDGTGLGLAITQRLVAMMGSKLEVHSVPGTGSRFWVDLDLPTIEGWAEPSAPTEARIVGYQGPRRTILVVDDKAENRQVLLDMLRPLGFELAEAEHGQQALERADTLHPDLILMDLRMPVMDGLSATRCLRENPDTAALPVIALSASAFDENREQSLAAGCNGFLTKPIRIERLLEEIGRHLLLTWIHEQPAEPAEAGKETPDQTLVVPDESVLRALHDLARKGDIGSIQEQVAALRLADSRYREFADRIESLARQYQIRQIRELLAFHLGPAE